MRPVFCAAFCFAVAPCVIGTQAARGSELRGPITWPAQLSRPNPPPARAIAGNLHGQQARGPWALHAAGGQYSIIDVGRPNKAGTSGVTAFNNAGQIAGFVVPTKGTALSCVVWNGKSFVTVKTDPTINFCYPLTINSGASGKYEIAGYLGYEYAQNSVAFTAAGASTGVPVAQYLVNNSPSLINGLNGAGVGIGESYFSPPAGVYNQFPPFVLSGATKQANFQPLQPTCTTFALLCMSYNAQEYYAYDQNCGFGGCAINDKNVVLGIDEQTQAYMIMTIGSPSSRKDLPFGPGTHAYYATINNGNQVAYAQYVSKGPPLYQSYKLVVGSPKPVALGQIQGASCNGYVPLGENNLGEILGIADVCTIGTKQYENLYWTWDAMHGMVNLNSLVPLGTKYVSFAAVGVNDSGQILVALQLKSGAQDWGMLKPGGVRQGSQRITQRSPRRK